MERTRCTCHEKGPVQAAGMLKLWGWLRHQLQVHEHFQPDQGAWFNGLDRGKRVVRAVLGLRSRKEGMREDMGAPAEDETLE